MTGFLIWCALGIFICSIPMPWMDGSFFSYARDDFDLFMTGFSVILGVLLWPLVFVYGLIKGLGWLIQEVPDMISDWRMARYRKKHPPFDTSDLAELVRKATRAAKNTPPKIIVQHPDGYREAVDDPAQKETGESASVDTPR